MSSTDALLPVSSPLFIDDFHQLHLIQTASDDSEMVNILHVDVVRLWHSLLRLKLPKPYHCEMLAV